MGKTLIAQQKKLGEHLLKLILYLHYDPALSMQEKCLLSLSGDIHANVFRATDQNTENLKLQKCLSVGV